MSLKIAPNQHTHKRRATNCMGVKIATTLFSSIFVCSQASLTHVNTQPFPLLVSHFGSYGVPSSPLGFAPTQKTIFGV